MLTLSDLGGNTLAVGYVILLTVAVFLFTFTRSSSRYPLPPGPPGEPLIGHLRRIPVDNPQLSFMKWAKDYDTDVLYFKMGRTPVVVLNSMTAAEELLNKRGSNYCDRPRFILYEIMGWGLTLTFMQWGNQWKAHRSLMQKSFTKSNVIQYQQLQEQEARQAAYSISQRPGDWEGILRRFASAIVLRIGFGVTLTSDNDQYIQLAIDANTATSKGGSAGTTVVDYFPFLRFFPDWIVNSVTLKHARQWSWAIKRLHDVPFAAVRKEFEAGVAKPSFVKPLLENYASNAEKGIPNNFTMAEINGAAASVFIAGSNTTFTTTALTILNLMRNPHIYLKAQKMLDEVVGSDRLPTLKDRDNPKLRYIEYLVEEAIRWRPLSPIGIPHKSLKDDVYNGMFIPKGSCVYYNAWAMSRDPAVYKHADEYLPERFTPVSEGGDEEPFLQGPFGFGRRLCVGKNLAQASIWIMVATLISTMTLSRPVGPDGEEIDQVVTFTTGLSSHPSHFEVVFTPRSEKAKMLLENSRY